MITSRKQEIRKNGKKNAKCIYFLRFKITKIQSLSYYSN